MSELVFRNVDASPEDPVETWPYEAVVTAIERGSLSDRRRIAHVIARDPWGRLSEDVLAYAEYGEEADVAALLVEAVRRARAATPAV